MNPDFFNFITDTTKEKFLASRSWIIQHPDYNPYSDDLSLLESLLEQNKFNEAIDFDNLNLILSPRAHMLKSYAFSKLGKEDESKSELILAHKIIEGIETTGNGSITNPYIITRIHDERDLLQYNQEQLQSQSLIQQTNKFLDVISTQSGKEIYFDITDCYSQMMKRHREFDILDEIEKTPIKRSWWKFW